MKTIRRPKLASQLQLKNNVGGGTSFVIRRNKKTNQNLNIRQSVLVMLLFSLILFTFSPYVNVNAEDSSAVVITNLETPTSQTQDQPLPPQEEQQPQQAEQPQQQEENIPAPEQQPVLPEIDATPNPAVPCGQNLIINGDFEQPVVQDPQLWDIFDSASSGIGWQADWHPLVPSSFNSTPRPVIGKIELQNGVNSWQAQSGQQYAEMDTDWDGPNGSLSGEPASIRLFQYLSTTPGQQYDVVFYTSPRPGLDGTDNNIEIDWNSIPAQGDGITEDGTNNTNTLWTKHAYVFTADSTATRLRFIDRGTQNSLGIFLDNVSVIERCPYKLVGQKFGDKNSNAQKDSGEKGLQGWTILAVDPNPVANIPVESMHPGGANTPSLATGKYLVTVTGAWTNRNDPNEMFDAEYYTPDGWVNHTDGTTGYPEAGYDEGDLQINGAFVDWGVYSPSHFYQTFFDNPGGAINFAVFEGDATSATKIPSWYTDNHKVLRVKVYKVITASVTGPLGNYELFIPGAYTGSDIWLFEVLKPDWIQTLPANPDYYTVALAENHLIKGYDFGNHNTKQIIEVPISGFKFNDLDGNGTWDQGEPGLQGWTIYYDANDNGVLDSAERSAVSDAAGAYKITGFGPGNYVFREVAQAGWVQTFPPSSGAQNITITTAPVIDANFGNMRAPADSGGCVDDCSNSENNGGGSSGTGGSGGTGGNNNTGGGSGGGGGAGSAPLTPQPQVLGINTGNPASSGTGGSTAQQPQVLGASTLPRTGMPIKLLTPWQLLTLLGIAIYFRRFSAKRLSIA